MELEWKLFKEFSSLIIIDLYYLKILFYVKVHGNYSFALLLDIFVSIF